MKPKPKEKGVEYNSYTEQIVENHLLLRQNIQNFSDSIHLFTDSMVFMQKHQELVENMDRLLKQRPTPLSHKDSLVYAASEGITNGYFETVGNTYYEIFSLYQTESRDSKVQEQKDSLLRLIREKDNIPVKYFNGLTDSTLSKLSPFD